MLDLINTWDTKIEIPNTFRGQPKTWIASAYNSSSNAVNVFEDLIKNTRAKFILISYNNKGIISEEKMKEILDKYGAVSKIPIEHNIYNRLKGIAEKKRDPNKINDKIKESLYCNEIHCLYRVLQMKILVPSLGESVTEATVAKWLKNIGESVSKDEVLVELETDKATLEVYAQSNGVLSEIYIDAGQDVEIGAELAEFLENENIDSNEVTEDVKLKSDAKNETKKKIDKSLENEKNKKENN